MKITMNGFIVIEDNELTTNVEYSFNESSIEAIYDKLEMLKEKYLKNNS